MQAAPNITQPHPVCRPLAWGRLNLKEVKMARSALLNVMVQSALKAGKSLTRDFGEVQNLQVSLKGPGDYVTQADRRSERVVREELLRARPTYGFLGEESEEIKGTDGAHRWIVDPLDGTTNFIHGFPQFCVSIALAVKGVMTHAVVYDPTRNELFTASKGAGAYLNDRRIRVSKRIRLDESLIGTGFPYRVFEHVDAYLGMFRDIMHKTAGIRRPGAAALDLAYVAAGRLDAFWEIGLSPWDMAAGSLLITEAGGLIGDLTGEAAFMQTGNIVGGNPKVFAQILQIIAPHLNATLQN